MLSLLPLQTFYETDTIVSTALSGTKAEEIKYLAQVTELLSDSRRLKRYSALSHL